MAFKTVYAPALAAAFAAFAMAGGIQASERIVRAEERAEAAAPAMGQETSIPFANFGNIRDWRPDGMNGLYVQDTGGRWYRATLMGPCVELPTANQIGFVTQGPDRIDKFSAITVRGQRCQFSSFVTSAAPPSRHRAPARG